MCQTISQVLATSRLASCNGAAAPGASSRNSNESSDDQEELELLSSVDDTRDLTSNDWARIRILDHQWCNPTGQYPGSQSRRTYRRPRLPSAPPDNQWRLDTGNPTPTAGARSLRPPLHALASRVQA